MRTSTRFLAAALGLALGVPAAAGGQAVPEAIVAEGVPAVPAELVRALEPYQNVRSASFQGWLGGKREVLISTRFGATNQVHRVATPLGARTQLTFGGERVLRAAPFPGSREAFLYTADEGGAENYQVFLADLKTGTTSRLTDGSSRHVLSGWSSAWGLLAFSSNARNGRDMDPYVMNPADPRSARRLKDVSGDWSVADWSPDDKTVAVVERVSANESYVYLIDVATGRTEPLTPKPASGAKVAYDDVKFAKDGRSLFWLTDEGSEFQRLARFDLGSKTSTVLTADLKWDVESFDLADDGQMIAFSTNEDGASKVYNQVYFRRETVTVQVPGIPDGLVSGLAFREGTREFGFTHASARSTGDVYSYDPAQQVVTQWTRSETGGLKTETFAEPELVRYPTFDGKPIPAFVYKADPSRFPGKRPVLVDIHGGPEGQSRPVFLGRLNYLIDALGITVIFPNVRGSTGYGKTYLALDNTGKREDSVKDVGALLDWVATRPDLDASKVAVMGGSYGGYMTLASLTHYSDRLKAGIDVVGISSFVTFLKNTSAYRRDLRRVEYGDERDPAMLEVLKRISPLASADKIKVPLMVVAGANDPRVPASESEQVVASVRKNGVPVWSLVAKNEGHGFARKENQDYMQYATILFLKQFLLGEKTP